MFKSFLSLFWLLFCVLFFIFSIPAIVNPAVIIGAFISAVTITLVAMGIGVVIFIPVALLRSIIRIISDRRTS